MPSLREEIEEFNEAIRAEVAELEAKGRYTEADVQRVAELTEKHADLTKRLAEAKKGQEFWEKLGRLNPEGRHEDIMGNGGGSLPTSAKGYLTITGRKQRDFAARIVTNATSRLGAKAFTVSGNEVTGIPLIQENPVELGKVPASVLEVLATTVRETPTYRYLRQSAFTNNAGIVAAGATKPETNIGLETIDGALSVFAHLSGAVDKYLVADNSSLTNFIGGQLLYGLTIALENEVINGDGTTGHLTGLLNTSGIQTQTAGADHVTTLRQAATKLESAGYVPSYYIVNTDDWATIETTRATNGSFDLGGPIDRAQRKVWGTQVVTSTTIPSGTAVAFDANAVGISTDGKVNTDWDASGDLFAKNQLRARTEGRFGLDVFQPTGVVKITLTA